MYDTRAADLRDDGGRPSANPRRGQQLVAGRCNLTDPELEIGDDQRASLNAAPNATSTESSVQSDQPRGQKNMLWPSRARALRLRVVAMGAGVVRIGEVAAF